MSKCLEKDVKKRISADHALHHPLIVSAHHALHLATWLHTLQYSSANNDTQWTCSMASLQADHDVEEEEDDSAPTTPDDVSPSLQIPNRNLLLHTPKEFHLF